MFLTGLEGGKCKIKSLAYSRVSDDNSLPGSQTPIFFLCPHVADGAKEIPGVSFLRALIPFVAPPSS